MKAEAVKDALRARHPAIGQFNEPGPWTCIEEWMNIDLLAVCAWASYRPYPRYARVGYEVKVSRADYKRELARPGKRAAAVAFCHEFYMAVPLGLLKDDELAWIPPWALAEPDAPFERLRCPGAFGAHCSAGRLVHMGVVDRRTPDKRNDFYRHRAGKVDYSRAYSGPCPTCRGAGWIAESPAVRAGAPKLWVPADVGLVAVEHGRVFLVKKAPRREVIGGTGRAVPVELNDRALADLIRWVSVRPDPRHAARNRALTSDVSFADVETP